MVDLVRVTYHVHGSGPVCLVHPGGPGIHWQYLRMPELVVLKQSGHFGHVEEPGVFQGGVLGFVSAH